MGEIRELGEMARKASREMVKLSSQKKNEIILSIAAELESRSDEILKANSSDVSQAKTEGFNAAFIDRLSLNESRLSGIIDSLKAVTELPDPVGKEISKVIRPNGLAIRKVRVPIGVLAVIYESRPNVTCDAAILGLKSSNAVILRGGSEAAGTNRALVKAIQLGGKKAGLPDNAVQIVGVRDRDAIKELVQLEGLVDLVIPRGGEKLIEAVTGWARVPVIKNAKGLCHVYVDESADLEMAVRISENAKCQRPGVCNAMETLLVHEKAADKFLPVMVDCYRKRGCEVRGCERTRQIVSGVKAASPEDWDTEYLDLIVSVRVVHSLEDAIEHIAKYGSKHSEAIITGSGNSAEIFKAEVDAAAVYVNASTRFTDGGEFGMGAEIGISTDKLHARGPMGLEELTTYKYLVEGNGQVRA